MIKEGRVKNFLSEWGGCSFWIVLLLAIIIACVHSCVQNKNRKENIAKQKQFVKDSIEAYHNSPEYRAHLDSVHLALKVRRMKREKNTAVMIYQGDSCYHYSTLCTKVASVLNSRFTSEYDAKQMELEECRECYKRKNIFEDYEDGQLVNIEDLTDKYTKQEIIEMFDITEYDLHYDRYDEREYDNEDWAPSRIR